MAEIDHSLVKLEHECCMLETHLPEETVLELYERVAGAKQQIREIDAALKCGMIEWINANGQIQHGTKRFYVGNKRTTKTKGKAAAIMAILDSTGGDLDALASLLVAEPIKPGAAKKQLGDELWDVHFEVLDVPDLKTGKATTTELKVVDERYLPQKKESNNA